MSYTNRYTAFIDILGFKELIRRSESDVTIQQLLSQVMNYLAGIRNENYEKKMSDIGKEVSVFSDSVVISWDGNCPGGGFYTLMDLIFICNALLTVGIFVRGGISYGGLIHDHEGARCYGPAMVSAYLLESNNAIYPRILVDTSVFEASFRNPGRANTPSMELEYLAGLVVKSKLDGLYYLNYLAQPNEFDSPQEYYEHIQRTRTHIITNLMSSRGNHRVYSKYTWFRDYFNSCIVQVYSDLSPLLIPLE